MKKIVQWLFAVYWVLCMLPYFIPALNQLEPHIGFIPFTVWYVFLVMTGCSVMIYIFSKSDSIWDTYDYEENEELQKK